MGSMLLSDVAVNRHASGANRPRASRSPTRRTTDEVKALLVNVALELFTADEFATTTTRAIAERAGVSESILFRHFPTKENLLATAIAQPFEQFLAEFSRTWEARDPGTLQPGPDNEPAQKAIVREFVAHLYEDLATRRELLRALLRTSVTNPGIAADVHARLQSVITPLSAIALESAQQRGVPSDHVDTDVRSIIAMITGLAVLDDWFLPHPAPSGDQLIDDVTDLLFHGIAGPKTAAELERTTQANRRTRRESGRAAPAGRRGAPQA